MLQGFEFQTDDLGRKPIHPFPDFKSELEQAGQQEAIISSSLQELEDMVNQGSF